MNKLNINKIKMLLPLSLMICGNMVSADSWSFFSDSLSPFSYCLRPELESNEVIVEPEAELESNEVIVEPEAEAEPEPENDNRYLEPQVQNSQETTRENQISAGEVVLNLFSALLSIASLFCS